MSVLYKVEKQETGTPDTSLTENNSNNVCLKTQGLEEVNYPERKGVDLGNNSDSLKSRL